MLVQLVATNHGVDVYHVEGVRLESVLQLNQALVPSMSMFAVTAMSVETTLSAAK